MVKINENNQIIFKIKDYSSYLVLLLEVVLTGGMIF